MYMYIKVYILYYTLYITVWKYGSTINVYKISETGYFLKALIER